MGKLLLLGSILILNHFACGKNILFLDVIPAPSHQMWDYTIIEELLRKGHNVTLLGNKSIKMIEHENCTVLELEDLFRSMNKILDDPMNSEKIQAKTPLDNIDVISRNTRYISEEILQSPNLDKLMNYPDDFTFDLLIFDVSLYGCLYPLIQKFNYPPTVGVVPFLLPQYVSEAFGNVVNPSYSPHMMSSFKNQMTFMERVENHFLSAYEMFKWTYVHKPKWEARVKDYFGQNTDDTDTLEQHISIVLANIMTGFHYARPLTPNIIPVGGAHIKATKPLPRDLKDIMENSKHGVILFSLGTLVNTDELNPSKIRMILETLGKLNETVIWKMDSNLEDVPKNVIVREWIPQNDMLAHPKMKAFISHCGCHGTMEAAYHGVPVIGLPVWVDQPHLGAQIESQKMGKVMDISSMTGDEFFDGIQEVLKNPMYEKNAREISAIVRDQPQTPLQRALFWIEWAMRHKNTKHIQPQSRYMSAFARSGFDVYLFFSLSFVVFMIILTKLFLSIVSAIVNNSKQRKLSKLKYN